MTADSHGERNLDASRGIGVFWRMAIPAIATMAVGAGGLMIYISRQLAAEALRGADRRGGRRAVQDSDYFGRASPTGCWGAE